MSPVPLIAPHHGGRSAKGWPMRPALSATWHWLAGLGQGSQWRGDERDESQCCCTSSILQRTSATTDWTTLCAPSLPSANRHEALFILVARAWAGFPLLRDRIVSRIAQCSPLLRPEIPAPESRGGPAAQRDHLIMACLPCPKSFMRLGPPAWLPNLAKLLLRG